MLISSPPLICLSRSQQKSSFGLGPDRRLLPRLGSFAGSGNDARCVGGGELDATDPTLRLDCVRGFTVALPGLVDDAWELVRDSCSGEDGADDEFGSVANGLEAGSSMLSARVMVSTGVAVGESLFVALDEVFDVDGEERGDRKW